MPLRPQGKILVVDDDEIMRDFYVRVFDNLGYRTVCAHDGEEAIAVLRDRPHEFALIMLDLDIPGRSGWDVISHVHGTTVLSCIPVIVIAGLSVDQAELQRLLDLGDHVILKGEFEMARLCDAVNRLLKQGCYRG